MDNNDLTSNKIDFFNDKDIEYLFWEIEVSETKLEEIRSGRNKGKAEGKGKTFHSSIRFDSEQFKEDISTIGQEINNEPEFAAVLNELMLYHGFNRNNLAAKTGISIDTIDKYRSFTYKQTPKKKYVAAIGIVMGVREDEMSLLMESAGHSYPYPLRDNSSAFNKAISYCLWKEERDIDNVNKLLKIIEEKNPQLKKRKSWYSSLT